jgi:uncharacterized protein (TIRG00374 family)
MKNRIVSRTIWFCVLAVMIYTASIIWTDARRNLEVFRAFKWSYLPLILGLVMINFVLREVKWDFFRRAAGIQVPRLGSFLVFFSGYSMAISPGRVGELIKPFMYKEYFGKSMRRSVPLVFCERLTDLLGMIVLALLSVVPFVAAISSRDSGAGQGGGSETLIYILLGASVVCMVGGIWFARQKRWVYSLMHRGMQVPRLRGTLKHLRHIYYATYPLLTIRNLIIATALGAVSWSFEVMAMKVIMNGVGAGHATLVELTFVFCMATIVGGFFFFLPGGLGGFEGAAFRLLQLLGVGKNAIVPAILIVRFSTLFFAVGLGFLFILLTSWKYHKSLEWGAFEQVSEEPAESVDLE